MKKLLALFAALLLVTACSTDDNENNSNTNPPNNDLRLVRMDLGFIDENTTYTVLEFDYDSDGRVVKVRSFNSDGTGGTFVSNYEYTDGRVVKIAYSNGTSRTFSYQGDAIVSSELNGTTWTYGYDTFGRLESIAMNPGCTTTYTYGGTSQPTESYNDCTQNTFGYTYDNKKNPEYYLFHASYSKALGLTPNNISGLMVTGPTIEASYTTNISYNENGWPTIKQYIEQGIVENTDRFYYIEP